MNRCFLVLALLTCFVQKQLAQENEISVKYYISTDDFLQDRLSDDEVIFNIFSKGEDYIHVKEILDPFTSKRSKIGNKAWAVAYNGEPYMNLTYSINSKSPNLFIRLRNKGRFCLAILDEDIQKAMKKAAPYYGGGLTGVILQASATWGGKYIDTAGIEKKIFIVDTKDQSMVIPYTAKNAPAELLTKATLKWLVGKSNYKGDASSYTVEEIVSIVENLNSRLKTK